MYLLDQQSCLDLENEVVKDRDRSTAFVMWLANYEFGVNVLKYLLLLPTVPLILLVSRFFFFKR